MTIVEAVKKAVEDDDPRLAGAVADTLRFKAGLDYNGTYAFAHEHTGVGEAEWEGLMYRADTEG